MWAAHHGTAAPGTQARRNRAPPTLQLCCQTLTRPRCSAFCRASNYSRLSLPSRLARLAEQCAVRSFEIGAPLVRQGDVSESFSTCTGRVRVERAGASPTERLMLAEVGAGEAIGRWACWTVGGGRRP